MEQTKFFLFLGIMLCCCGHATAVCNFESVPFTVDASKSNIRWDAKKVTGSHWGNVKFSHGVINTEHEVVKMATLIMDMNSIEVKDLEPAKGGYKLSGHLRSEDFFNVAQNPTAKLVVTSVTPAANGSMTCVADLTIKGITNEIIFPATISFISNVLMVAANFKIDRTKWDLKYGSGSFFSNLGNKAIDDNFEVSVNIVAVSEGSTPAQATNEVKKVAKKVNTRKTQSSAGARMAYQCPKGCSMVDAPGSCPKCGSALIAVHSATKNPYPNSPASIPKTEPQVVETSPKPVEMVQNPPYVPIVNEKRLALVIGNANYSGGAALRNPVNDANLMATTLQNLGFEVLKITDADKRTMEQGIRNFSKKLPNYNIGLFYYAGHGILVNGSNYLIPIDATLKERDDCKYEAIPLNFMVEEFEKYSNNVNIVILDACRNNPFRSWSRGEERGLKAIPPASGTIISFATSEGATAADGNSNNGTYTAELVKQMVIPQSVEEVFKKTRIEVEKLTNNAQSPQEWSKLKGNFYFKK